MSALAGQHAVVTGGSRGIGFAVASALAEVGAQVTIMGRNRDRLQAAADELNARPIVCDVTQAQAVEAAFAQCDPVNILVNNAGNATSAPFHRTTLDLWRQMLDVNLTSAYLCTQAVVSGMVERSYGRIINIASTAALTGYAYVSAYCAAKHGLLGLTRSLALELATKGVTVNAVCPGYTDTDMIAGSIDNIVSKTGREADSVREELERHNPQGRLIQPEEVAHSVLWLCLPGSGAITGQPITVAGGELL
jgi:3-hydroxybutyrate dehydrogenase